MKRLLRKTLVIIVVFAPLFTNTDCKKQKRCGCGKDVLSQLINSPSNVYFDSENSTIITMQRLVDPYSFYTFCNPDEIMPKLANFRSGEELMVSGNVYWDCNYVWQASNNPYQSSLYQSYTIHVTDIYMNMYGKDDSNEELKKGF